MGCSGCSNGRGCTTLPAGCKSNGNCSSGGCNKLDVFDWLAGMNVPGRSTFDVVEVRFKHSRKGFYRASNMELHVGDPVAVETVSGHDIGTVSLSGELVKFQMQKKNQDPQSHELRKVYRKATQADIDTWIEAQGLEEDALVKSRKAAKDLNLDMKISDVEYQGDKTKATFYFTAEDRVDFRELIRILADLFKVRIEMRQIGARQESARIGGIGSCGRELCCSTWLTDFRSVSTSAARYQQLSLNPMKLAGQCGKLKCCLNYELDAYMEALKEFPKNDKKLETKSGNAVHMKTDIFKRTMWYAYESEMGNFIPLAVNDVKDILEMNKNGKKPESLKDFMIVETVEAKLDYENVVGQDDLTRFDKDNRSNKKRNKRRKKKKGGGGKNPNQLHAQKSSEKQPSKRNHPNNNSTKGGGGNRRKRKPNNGGSKKE